MSGHIFRLDIPAHQAVQELLPWYISAQLAPEEAARVQEHLYGCEECRHEADFARRLRGLEPAAPQGLDVDRALSRMISMLGEQEQAPAAATLTAAAVPFTTSMAQRHADPLASESPLTTTTPTAFPQAGETRSAAVAPVTAPAVAPATAAAAAAAAPATATAPANGVPVTPAAPAWTPQRAANQASWGRWAMAAQAVAIAGLLVLLARPAADNAN